MYVELMWEIQNLKVNLNGFSLNSLEFKNVDFMWKFSEKFRIFLMEKIQNCQFEKIQ